MSLLRIMLCTLRALTTNPLAIFHVKDSQLQCGRQSQQWQVGRVQRGHEGDGHQRRHPLDPCVCSGVAAMTGNWVRRGDGHQRRHLVGRLRL